NARIAGAGDLHEITAGDGGGRIREVHVVERIERFEAELELLPLSQREVLVQPEIRVEGARPAVGVASQHAVSAGRIHREGGPVQVLRGDGSVPVVVQVRRYARQVRALASLAG